MCDCIEKVTDEMTSHVVGLNEGGILDGYLVQKQWPVSNGNVKPSTTFTDYEYQVVPVKKDGTEGKPKTKRIRVSHSYCPFCGEKHKND